MADSLCSPRIHLSCRQIRVEPNAFGKDFAVPYYLEFTPVIPHYPKRCKVSLLISCVRKSDAVQPEWRVEYSLLQKT